MKPKVKPPILKNTPIAKGMSVEALESIVFDRINRYRLSQNLNPLKLHPRITQLAREHSRKMASGAVSFSHNGFNDRVKAISTALPYQGAAENVAFNYGYKDPVAYSVNGWLNSPGHYKNIVGKYNLTGVGVAKNSQGEYYFTQIFVYSP